MSRTPITLSKASFFVSFYFVVFLFPSFDIQFAASMPTFFRNHVPLVAPCGPDLLKMQEVEMAENVQMEV